MNEPTPMLPGWLRGIAAAVVVAATYFYFLIFAEFALLELARDLDPGGGRLRVLMGVLGAGGVTGSLLAARFFRSGMYAETVAGALLACGVTAAWASWAGAWVDLVVAAGAVGLSLGGLTVTLASGLRAAIGERSLGRCIGLGTGLAYAMCNLPAIFTANAALQTALAVVAVSVGALATIALRGPSGTAESEPTVAPSALTVGRWLVVLLMLVWFDSAAFYIIQHTPALRAATWEGDVTLWVNAAVHLGAALLAGALLDRGRRGPVAGAAAALLALACLGLDGGVIEGWPVEWLYTAGVSLYSVVLVHVPAQSGRPWVAGLVFAVAGWAGSALGIGMAQDLQRVPLEFVVAAGAVLAVVAFAPRVRWPMAVAGIAVAMLAPGGLRAGTPLIEQGRRVYIAEGCIHCHSQYVRPRTDDVVRWGPATDLPQSLKELPPLYGNRRQGPDLAQVGNRRNEVWNRLHLIAPRTVSPGSRMPSYAHLFAGGDGRGEALVAYLASLGTDTQAERLAQVQAWKPAPGTKPAADAARRFAALCAPCHGAGGQGDGPLAGRLGAPPPDFSRGAWRYVRDDDEVLALMRIVKFGVPGTAMAGHEYLRDEEVFALALHAQALHAAGGGNPRP